MSLLFVCHRLSFRWKRGRQRSESFPFVAFDSQLLSFFFLSSLSSPRCYTFIMSPPDLFATFVAGFGTHIPLPSDVCVSMLLRFIIFAPPSVSSCVVSDCCFLRSLSSTLFVRPAPCASSVSSSVVAGNFYSFLMDDDAVSFHRWLLPCSPFDINPSCQ